MVHIDLFTVSIEATHAAMARSAQALPWRALHALSSTAGCLAPPALPSAFERRMRHLPPHLAGPLRLVAAGVAAGAAAAMMPGGASRLASNATVHAAACALACDAEPSLPPALPPLNGTAAGTGWGWGAYGEDDDGGSGMSFVCTYWRNMSDGYGPMAADGY